MEDIGLENEYFYYIGEDCLDVFVERMDEILTNFATFERTKILSMTDGEKMEHSAATGCYICDEKFNQKDFKKSKIIAITQGMKVLLI